MVCATTRFLIVVMAALIMAPEGRADRVHMEETHTCSQRIDVVARGQLTDGAAAYTFVLDIEKDPTPTLHLGDRVRISNRGASEFSPIIWWQNGRRYVGKSCSGFIFKNCKKTYHNYQNKDIRNYSVTDVRFGLRPLAEGECRDVPKDGSNEELIVTFPSRLCVIGDGRFSKPAVVHGEGDPEGPVRVFRMIGDEGKRVFVFDVKIVREK